MLAIPLSKGIIHKTNSLIFGRWSKKTQRLVTSPRIGFKPTFIPWE